MLGASEYSPATGSNAAEITDLQDQVRDLRPQLGRAQSDIDAARGDLAAAGAQLPQARRAALEGLPGGVHARAFDRVAERNAELAPWVDRNGDLKREVVREEAGRMLRAYQRYANHDRRAKALALLGDKNDPQARAAFDTAERERAKARGELEAGGWNFGDDAKINLPDSPVGKGFAHAFSSNSVSRRERKAKADWDTAYESPDSTVARLSEAAKGQEAIATVMQALGFFSPSVFIGPGRPSTQVAEEKSDEAKEADKRAAAVVRAIDEFVAKHSVPGRRAALKRALLEGLVGLSEATIRKLLQDAASTFGPYDLDPEKIIGRVMDLFQEGARQINAVDGAARAALARVEAMRGLAEGLLAAGGSVTEEVIKNASAGYEDALAKAAAALDAQQAAAMARGHTCENNKPWDVSIPRSGPHPGGDCNHLSSLTACAFQAQNHAKAFRLEPESRGIPLRPDL
ncbi:MAG: hypothetical protein GKR99_11070 [Rhodobacteraceae bacterium]|nr:hypothetical protein [Paracoccaceae bacterium]